MLNCLGCFHCRSSQTRGKNCCDGYNEHVKDTRSIGWTYSYCEFRSQPLIIAICWWTLEGILSGNDKFWIAFVATSTLRIIYDVGLFTLFVNMKLHQHEENDSGSSKADPRRSSDEEELEDLPKQLTGWGRAETGWNGGTAGKPSSLHHAFPTRLRGLWWWQYEQGEH